MSKAIGIDSRKFVRKGSVNDFVAIIGTGIEVKSYDYFKEKYISIISDLFKKRGIVLDRTIYKSYDLQRLGITHDFYKEFYDKISDHIDKLYFFYTYFKKTPQTNDISIYPLSSKKKTSFVEFISKHLEPSYPHVCNWQLNTKFKYTGKVYLDSFNGKVTNAWKTIEGSQSIFIIPNGDKSNALISTSDILINFFDSELSGIGGNLIPENIETIFSKFKNTKKLERLFISNACLGMIVPLSEALNMPVHQKYIHPICFIFKEAINTINEKTIENSPMFKKIIDLSFKNNGGFKFFDTDFDYNIISDEDYLVYFGENGKKTVDNLKNLGFSFKPLNFAELEKL